MSFDPIAAYKKSITNPDDKKKSDEFWERFEKNKQLKKACPIDPQEAEQCDSCQ